MNQVVKHEKYGEISYEESAWTGRKALSINGVPLNKISKKEFQTQDGKTATVTGNFLWGANLVIDGETISLTPRIKWYEIALCLLPFILIMVWGNVPSLCRIIPVVGGALGGFISALFSCLGLIFIKKMKTVGLKLLVALAAIVVTFGICVAIAYVILGAM